MIIMSLDYGYANSGICIAEIKSNKIKIIYSDTILSNKKYDTIERIDGLVEELYELYEDYDIDYVYKETPFVGRASTAKNVLYAHAILEYVFGLWHGIRIEEIHNASLKAFCKKYMIDNNFYTKEELKQFDKKEVVAEFLKSYLGDNVPDIYTKRGRLKDDECDAIALSVYYFENLK